MGKKDHVAKEYKQMLYWLGRFKCVLNNIVYTDNVRITAEEKVLTITEGTTQDW